MRTLVLLFFLFWGARIANRLGLHSFFPQHQKAYLLGLLQSHHHSGAHPLHFEDTPLREMWEGFDLRCSRIMICYLKCETFHGLFNGTNYVFLYNMVSCELSYMKIPASTPVVENINWSALMSSMHIHFSHFWKRKIPMNLKWMFFLSFRKSTSSICRQAMFA